MKLNNLLNLTYALFHHAISFTVIFPEIVSVGCGILFGSITDWYHLTSNTRGRTWFSFVCF